MSLGADVGEGMSDLGRSGKWKFQYEIFITLFIYLFLVLFLSFFFKKKRTKTIKIKRRKWKPNRGGSRVLKVNYSSDTDLTLN